MTSGTLGRNGEILLNAGVMPHIKPRYRNEILRIGIVRGGQQRDRYLTDTSTTITEVPRTRRFSPDTSLQKIRQRSERRSHQVTRHLMSIAALLQLGRA